MNSSRKHQLLMTDFVGAKLVAQVFLAAAVVVILVVSTLFLAVYIFSRGGVRHPSSENLKVVVVAGTILGSILVASVLGCLFRVCRPAAGGRPSWSPTTIGRSERA
jgi:hypothetical protein